MSDSESDTAASLREQLIEARDRLRRELDIVRYPTSIGGGADNRGVIAELEAELREIVDALAGRP
jgi:hypothetical protein